MTGLKVLYVLEKKLHHNSEQERNFLINFLKT
jgi:hypothetical protein